VNHEVVNVDTIDVVDADTGALLQRISFGKNGAIGQRPLHSFDFADAGGVFLTTEGAERSRKGTPPRGGGRRVCLWKWNEASLLYDSHVSDCGQARDRRNWSQSETCLSPTGSTGCINSAELDLWDIDLETGEMQRRKEKPVTSIVDVCDGIVLSPGRRGETASFHDICTGNNLLTVTTRLGPGGDDQARPPLLLDFSWEWAKDRSLILTKSTAMTMPGLGGENALTMFMFKQGKGLRSKMFSYNSGAKLRRAKLVHGL